MSRKLRLTILLSGVFLLSLISGWFLYRSSNVYWDWGIFLAFQIILISILGVYCYRTYRLPLIRLREELWRMTETNRSASSDVVQDVEELIHELKKDHEKEIEKLREIETFRREFLGNVSHELKTPIFAIQGFIDTLLDGALEDPIVNRKFLEKALKHTDRLDNLVKDLLIISQLETGQLQMNMEDFRLHDLIHEVFEALEYKLTRKGRSITLRIDPNGQEHLKVHADRERIRQVMINLVDNAIKYGKLNGVITVEVSKQNSQKVLIRVLNEGSGIDSEHIPRLFERFYRVDKSRSREKGGTGLGLAIVKHLIEAHKEKISVESNKEKGSIFTFSLALTS
jgi:two-component system phosphate regulon sensor histidine kinase PhoR